MYEERNELFHDIDSVVKQVFSFTLLLSLKQYPKQPSSVFVLCGFSEAEPEDGACRSLSGLGLGFSLVFGGARGFELLSVWGRSVSLGGSSREVLVGAFVRLGISIPGIGFRRLLLVFLEMWV